MGLAILLQFIKYSTWSIVQVLIEVKGRCQAPRAVNFLAKLTSQSEALLLLCLLTSAFFVSFLFPFSFLRSFLPSLIICLCGSASPF